MNIKLIFSCIIIVCSSHTFSQTIPNIMLYNIDGTKINTATFNDTTIKQPIVLAFWASWCLPCISELSIINDDFESIIKKNKIQLYAIATDDSRTIKKVAPLVYGKGWQFSVLLDENQQLKRSLNVTNIPTVLVVKNGKIVYKHNGYAKGDEQQLYKFLLNNE